MAKKGKKASTGGAKKKKPVSISPIKDEPNSVPHAILHDMIEQHHADLGDIKVGLFWVTNWKAENDTGVIKLWKVAKASETVKALSKFDVLIYLNEICWQGGKWTREHHEFILDSALCEISPDRDRDGEQKIDENNRDLWRILKPTVQTFPEIVARHGLATVELQKLAQSCANYSDAKRPLFDWLSDQPAAEAAEQPKSAA